MNNNIAHLIAWEDFFEWVKDQPFWSDIKRRDKQYIYKAQKDFRDGSLGVGRVVNILMRYAPERYRMVFEIKKPNV